jgi:hypothetical protein
MADERGPHHAAYLRVVVHDQNFSGAHGTI